LYEPKYWYGTRHAVLGRGKPVPYKGGCSFVGFSVGFCHLSNRLWHLECLILQKFEAVTDSAHVPGEKDGRKGGRGWKGEREEGADGREAEGADRS